MSDYSLIVALPCIAFSVKEREIIRKYGFLTYPEFLDNFYVRHRTRGWSLFVKKLKEHSGEVKFAVLPDYQYKIMEHLMNRFSVENWIFPLHKLNEVDIARELGVKWLGMPHRKKWRDYTIQDFVKLRGEFKLWYLGFWNERQPWVLQYFDGFDTTIPETYSGKFGKIWLTWNKSVKSEMKTIEIFETNVINFRKAISTFD